jgi:glycerophosphoryl diester phosphodiesterase
MRTISALQSFGGHEPKSSSAARARSSLTPLDGLPAVWAHRGASAAKQENTIEAFREAVRLGADGVELDVRRSADPTALVVHHDAVLADGRAIADLRAADLPPHVPLLADAVDACDGILVNVEIKNLDGDPDHDPSEHLATAVAALVAERGMHDRVVVSSFSLATIDRVIELDGDIRCGYLTSPRWDQDDALRRAADHGHAAIHPHHVTVNAGLVERAHAAGLAVNVWTVDDPDRIRWLAQLGVDAVVTNVPDVAIGALRARA